VSEKRRFVSIALSVVVMVAVIPMFADSEHNELADAQKLLAEGQRQFQDYDFTAARGTLWKAYKNRTVLSEPQQRTLASLLGEVDVAISESVKAQASFVEANQAIKAGKLDTARGELTTVADCHYVPAAERAQARTKLEKVNKDITLATAKQEQDSTQDLEFAVASANKSDTGALELAVAEIPTAPQIIVAEDSKKTDQEKVTDLVTKGETALKNNQPEKAAEFFSQALVIDGSNEGVRKRLDYARQLTADPVPTNSILSELVKSKRIERQMTNGQIDRALKEARQGISKPTAREDYIEALQKAKFAKSTLLNKKRLFTAAETRNKLAEIDECIDWITREQEKWDKVQLKKQMAKIEKEAYERHQNVMQQRQKKLDDMERRVRSLVHEKKLEQAIDVLDQMIELDVNNTWATSVKYGLEQSLVLKVQKEYYNELIYESTKISTDIRNSEIPWFERIRYPKDWKELTERRKRYSASRGSETEENRLLRTKLQGKISPEFDGQPFSDVIDYFREVTDANIYVNWKAIEEAGIDRSQTVDVKLRDVPFLKALQLVLNDVGGAAAELGYVLSDGVLTISTKSDLDRATDTRTYDIHDLIARVPDFPAPRVSLESVGESSGGSSGGGGGGGDLFGGDEDGDTIEGEDEPVTRSAAIARIKQLIIETIDPGNWRPEGDKGSIDSLRGILVINQTPENHSEIEKLIATLRESRAIQVTVEARFIVVQTGFLSQIGVDLDFYFNLGSQISTAAPTTPYGPSAWTTGGYHGVSTTSKFSPVSVENNSATFANVAQETTIVAGGIGATMTNLGLDSAMTIAGTFLDDIQVDFLIEATQAHQSTRTLTAPRLTLYNGQRAYVSIQTSQAYISGVEQIVSENETAPEPEISYAPNSAILDVDVTVSHDRRYIQMTLRPQVVRSEIDNATTVTGVTIGLPTYTIQEVLTTVSVPDGGTLLIGGQKISEEVEREMGVPILSKLPVINRAFTNKGKLRDESTLLILVKPQVIILDEAEEDEKLHDEDPVFGRGVH
jgi:tetratricopeptide (TPR) repeat protein